MRFVPVQFGEAYVPPPKTDGGFALHLTPSSASVPRLQSGKLSNTRSGRNYLDSGNSEYIKVHLTAPGKTVNSG